MNLKLLPITFLAAFLAAFSIGSAYAEQEAVVVLQSTVTGNQEQPKVLYIVPWQQPDGPESLYRPLTSLVDDVFQPVERVEFVRELNYRQMLADAQQVEMSDGDHPD